MRNQITLAALTAVVLMAASCSGPANPTPSSRNQHDGADSTALRVAVVTGGHAFDVQNFYRLFRELPGIDAYPQHLEHFSSSPEEVRDAYDAVVFYGMGSGVPAEEGAHYEGKPRAALERIVEQGQGVVIMHHALLAWEKWPFWNELIGFDNRNFRYKEGLQLTIAVNDTTHPITSGMQDFETLDEGYVLHGNYDDQGTVLLTTEHEDAMPQVAWAREQGDCRVFCLALGHDHKAWANESFREILRRGIVWSAE